MDKERKDTVAMDTRRVGYWPLREDFKDASSNERHGKGESVLFQDGAAVFDGENSQVLLPDAEITTVLGRLHFPWSLRLTTKTERFGRFGKPLCSDRMEGWHLTPMTQTGAFLHFQLAAPAIRLELAHNRGLDTEVARSRSTG